jgi:hypothetical protein
MIRIAKGNGLRLKERYKSSGGRCSEGRGITAAELLEVAGHLAIYLGI